MAVIGCSTDTSNKQLRRRALTRANHVGSSALGGGACRHSFRAAAAALPRSRVPGPARRGAPARKNFEP